MFSLLVGFWNYFFTKAEIHILIIGLDEAGKTTLLEQLKSIYGKKAGIPLDKIPPTVGLNIARVDIKRSRIIFWDLGGQQRLRAIWSKYYSESHGIVFMLDASNQRRFQEAKESMDAMLAHSELENVPLLVLVNKMDKEDAQDVQTVSKFLAFDDFPNAKALFPISALTRDGLEQAIEQFVDMVRTSERFQRAET